MKGATTWTYEYDVRDQLRRVTNGASELARYDYDPEKRRLLTVSGFGGITGYVYAGNQVIEERVERIFPCRPYPSQ